MKNALVIIISLFLVIAASPASFGQDNTVVKTRYMKLNVIGSLYVPLVSSAKDLSVAFPYIGYDNNGTPVPSEYNGVVGKPFSTALPTIGVNLDFGYHSHFYTVRACGSSFDNPKGTYNIALGYGYNWSLRNGAVKSTANQDLVIISTSMCLAVMNKKERFGDFDNGGSIITAFGKDISPDYSTSDDNGFTTTHHANQIAVVYSQTGYGLEPHIAVVTNPFRSLLNIELDLSYFLPLFQQARINLYRHETNGTDGDYSIAVKSELAENDVVTKVNNIIATKSPLSLSSFQVGIRIGLSGRY